MNVDKVYKYLDLSGFAFTGKHAVIDLVREFNGYCVPHFEFEFNLIRIQGGIRDLETALVDDWSPIRSDAAIRRFRRLVDRFASKNSFLSPRSWFSAVGWNYEDFFHNKFQILSKEYLDRLTESSWITDWPYPRADIAGNELFCRKLLKFLGSKKSMDFEVCLSAPGNFIELTRDYLNMLMTAFAEEMQDVTTVVMHNSLEPFNPARAIRYFHNAKAIIVDRDPRDNYVAGLWYRPTALPAQQFVKRYRLYRQIVKRYPQDEKKVLRLQFERLVLDYERTIDRIFNFLGEDSSVHWAPKKYFDPAKSSKNIGIWKTYDKQDEIEMIYRELRDFCWA